MFGCLPGRSISCPSSGFQYGPEASSPPSRQSSACQNLNPNELQEVGDPLIHGIQGRAEKHVNFRSSWIQDVQAIQMLSPLLQGVSLDSAHRCLFPHEQLWPLWPTDKGPFPAHFTPCSSHCPHGLLALSAIGHADNDSVILETILWCHELM